MVSRLMEIVLDGEMVSQRVEMLSVISLALMMVGRLLVRPMVSKW
jgi:hypothetical protein